MQAANPETEEDSNVTTTVSECTDIRKRASELGLEPVRDIALLPQGIESAETADSLVFNAETATLRKLLVESGIGVHQPKTADGEDGVHIEKSADWIAPLIFIGARTLLENPNTVSLLLAVLEQFVVRVTRGLHNPRVKLSFALEIEEGKKYQRLDYEGPPKAIKDVEELIRGLTSEQDDL